MLSLSIFLTFFSIPSCSWGVYELLSLKELLWSLLQNPVSWIQCQHPWWSKTLIYLYPTCTLLILKTDISAPVVSRLHVPQSFLLQTAHQETKHGQGGINKTMDLFWTWNILEIHRTSSFITHFWSHSYFQPVRRVPVSIQAFPWDRSCTSPCEQRYSFRSGQW